MGDQLKPNEKNRKRVLHVLYGGAQGGIENVVINYYKYINKENYQFDFVIHSKEEFDFYEEIRKLGGEIFFCPTLGQGVINYIRSLKVIFKDNGKYDAVHIHTGHQSGIVGFAAMISGIKVRICHSHNTTLENSIYQKLLPIWKTMIFTFCNNYIACSQESGRIWFNKRNFTVLPNAIDFKKYKEFDIRKTKVLKTKLGIPEESIVLGHAGRFVKVKNQKFLLNLMQHLHKKGSKDIHLILAGDGPLLDDLMKISEEYNLENNIHFLGHYKDMPVFWGSVNIMLLPSFNEGFPLVLAEAQAAGVFSILSDKVRSAKESEFDNYILCDLNNLDEWIYQITNYKKTNKKEASSVSDFNLEHSVKKLESIYSTNILK